MPEASAVFVVDDDPAIREYYRKLLQPGEDELDILGSAGPGDDALPDISGGASAGPYAEESAGSEASAGADRLDLRIFSRPSLLAAAFAAERAAGRRVPLCILDMRMPERSGLSLALELRKLDPELSIIICSAYSDAGADELRRRLRGGVYLVSKPFAPDNFRLLVHSLLREWQGRRVLKASEERLRRVMEATNAGTWEWHVPSGRADFDARWAAMLGYGPGELGPGDIATWRDRLHPDDAPRVGEELERHLSGEAPFFDIEYRMRHRDGHWIWTHDQGKVTERDAAGQPLLMYGAHADITGRKLLEEQIRELAIRDPLTEAYNRRYVFERLVGIAAEFTRRGRNFCVSMLDIDNFKSINDLHGHQTGDAVLRRFALAISTSIRLYDLLGRYGGEEFIIVSPSSGAAETAVLIERIMEKVRGMEFESAGERISFTFSSGIADSAEFDREAFSVEAIIAAADRRLYAAKAAGKNRYIGP